MRRNRTQFIARALVALALLLAIVWFVDLETIAESFRGADAWWIAAAVGLLPLNIFLETLKWRLLLRAVGAEVSISDALGSVLAGYSLGLVTPLRVGDHAGRILFVSDRRKALLLILSLIDRIYSIWVHAVAGTIAMAYFVLNSVELRGGIWWLTLVLGAIICSGAGVIVLKPSLLASRIESVSSAPKWARWTRRIVRVGGAMPSVTLKALALTGLRYFVFSTQFVLLLIALDPAPAVVGLYLGSALVFFVKTVVPSISIFDLGIRESAAVLFLGFFGVPAAAAFGASVLLFGVNIVLPALAGAPSVPRLEWQWKRQPERSTSTLEADTS